MVLALEGHAEAAYCWTLEILINNNKYQVCAFANWRDSAWPSKARSVVEKSEEFLFALKDFMYPAFNRLV